MYFFVCMSILHLVLKTCSLETGSSTPENTTLHKRDRIGGEMPLYWYILLVVITVVVLTMAFLVCWHKRGGLASAVRQNSSTLRAGDPTASMPPEMGGSSPEPGEIMYAELSLQTRMQTKRAAASYRIKGIPGVVYAELRDPQQHTVYHN